MTFMSFTDGKGFNSSKSSEKLFGIDWKLNVNFGLQLRKELGENALTQEVKGARIWWKCKWLMHLNQIQKKSEGRYLLYCSLSLSSCRQLLHAINGPYFIIL